MVTQRQKLRGARVSPQSRKRSQLFGPQRKRVCVKVWTRSPKKPNSATRKGGTFQVMYPKKKKFAVRLPGEHGHGLSQFSLVLLRGGRCRDLPGMKYKAIRGVFDFPNVAARKQRRSKYGQKKRDIAG